MTTISAAMVKQLREKTGAGIMDCKEALTECDGDMEKAVDFLRKKGIGHCPETGRPGHVRRDCSVLYSHGRQNRGSGRSQLRDGFRGKNDDFMEFARNMAMHIAATNPAGSSRKMFPQRLSKKKKKSTGPRPLKWENRKK